MTSFPHLPLAAFAAAFSLHLPVQAAAACQKPAKEPAASADTALSTHDEAGVLGLQRVSQDALAEHLTAKDVIGAKVMGRDGESLGEIADISLIRGVNKQTKMQELARLGDLAAPETGGMVGVNPVPPPPDDSGRESQQDDSPPIDVNAAAPVAVIAVGGLLGIGERLVSVPLAALKYHPDEDRFSLPVSKVEFEAMAGERTQETDTRQLADAGPPEAAAAAKMMEEDLSDTAADIRRALSDPVLQPSGSRLGVSEDGSAITISGTVKSQMDKDRILANVREITSRPIIDQIRVDG
ncbi:MAG: hypothetical protein ACREIA_12035 [Opitutaceae bacterium]